MVLSRELAPLGGCFFGFYTVLAAVFALVGICVLLSHMAEWKENFELAAIGTALTLFGLGMRQVYYKFQSTRDREIVGILETALANLNRA